jgi:RNA polymerase sigma-70 factor (ECF subfamily)
VGRLANIYAASADGEATDADALEHRLIELCARGRAAHAMFGIEDEAFVAHLARCGASVDDVLSTLHVEDLYLACACLAGNAQAIGQLREMSRPVLVRYLSRIGNAHLLFEEVEQRLWDSVLVGAVDGPRLATYAGRGPLGSWLGVSAQRIALMELRHERAESRARNEVAARARLTADDPELAAIKERFRDKFQEAFAVAIQTLTDRERTVYRMHLVDGLTLEQIAKAYGVHHTTVLRWLSAARARVLEEAKRRLRAELPVSSGEFDSIARLLMDEVDLNISLVLAHQK